MALRWACGGVSFSLVCWLRFRVSRFLRLGFDE